MSALGGTGRHDSLTVAYRGSTGRIWRYKGKRARVLAMLASGRGITQWDCLPWHTRLATSIDAMREDGLEIETQIEGRYRHARYWLRTPGLLLLRGIEGQPEPEPAA